MKVKLLKKLRRIHTIQKRNGEYRYFRTKPIYDAYYNCHFYDMSSWTKDLEHVTNIWKDKIIEHARNYKYPKSTL